MLFRMALLPAVLAYGWSSLYRIVFRQLGLLGFGSPGQMAAGVAAGWVIGAFYWTISGFFFAVVAASILAKADEEIAPFTDAFTLARSRIGAVVAMALICWTLFWMGRSAAGFAVLGLLRLFPQRPGFYATRLLFSLPLFLLVGPLSRLGLTIPGLMCEPTASLKQALRTSLQKTENWEFFFMMFLAKSAGVGYFLFWFGNQGLGWLWQRGVLNETSYPWIAQTVYISIAAALESPLFIAFSLLYRDSGRQREGTLTAAVVE